MKQKIICFLKSIWEWLSDHCGRKRTPPPTAPGPSAAGPDVPPCVKHIGQVLAGAEIRRRRGKASGIRYINCESFTDAYRFLLRLGCQEGLVCTKKGGHICYRLDLPDNGGHVILSERVGNRRDTLAVMLFHIAGMPEIKELRFQSRQDKAK